MGREIEKEDEQLDLYRKLDSTEPAKKNQLLLVITINVHFLKTFNSDQFTYTLLRTTNYKILIHKVICEMNLNTYKQPEMSKELYKYSASQMADDFTALVHKTGPFMRRVPSGT